MIAARTFLIRTLISLFLLTASTLSGVAQTTQSPAGSTTTQTPAETKPPLTAKELLEQGKTQYRKANYKVALQKFEAALKLEPQHDEGLMLAAVTAFRLDNQPRARDLFQKRAQLPEQKDSVIAYCNYWSALTRWRQAHDLIARKGTLKTGHVTYALPEKEVATAREHITRGLEEVSRALEARPDYSDALNIKNLLHAEAALIAADENQASDERKAALAALSQAFGKLEEASQTKTTTADFGRPTVRVGEYPERAGEDSLLDDPILLKLEGGRPTKRFSAVIPPYQSPKPKDDSGSPESTGVTSGGGAYSVGPGRGALFGQLTPGLVKVEILVGTDGKVVFAQQVGGKPEIGGLAVAAAKKWLFQPATLDGKPVQISGVITFDVRTSKGKAAATPSTTSTPKTN